MADENFMSKEVGASLPASLDISHQDKEGKTRNRKREVNIKDTTGLAITGGRLPNSDSVPVKEGLNGKTAHEPKKVP